MSHYNIDTFEKALLTKNESYWISRGQKNALRLFKEMSKRVPAYKDFLKINKIDPVKIKSSKDLVYLPTLDKDNYLRKYPLEMLCWDGEFASKNWVISSTSGSTGEPYYFPRQQAQDSQYALTAELYLRTNFDLQNKKTLYIVGFPMGAWIGGVFTYQALKQLSESNKYSLSIITPGINKKEIINIVKRLGKEYDQVIIGSYGPFLKDILDEGLRNGLNWKEYNLKFVFSAEVFDEKFRDFVLKTAGAKDIYRTTLNHYGTVDLGTMAYETPLSVLARRTIIKKTSLYRNIFGNINKLPTLAQYMPEIFYFEDVDGALLCSSFSGLPLMRYDLKDNGGVIPYRDLVNIFKSHQLDINELSIQEGISNSVWKLPFVYVYERSDFSVSFFAFQIYPETIRKALQDKLVQMKITGKFTMMVKFDQDSNQYFEINIELKPNTKPTRLLERRIKHLVIKRLLLENSEFRKTNEVYPERTSPKIVFWDYEDPIYFRSGGKQKWVQK